MRYNNDTSVTNAYVRKLLDEIKFGLDFINSEFDQVDYNDNTPMFACAQAIPRRVYSEPEVVEVEAEPEPWDDAVVVVAERVCPVCGEGHSDRLPFCSPNCERLHDNRYGRPRRRPTFAGICLRCGNWHRNARSICVECASRATLPDECYEEPFDEESARSHMTLTVT